MKLDDLENLAIETDALFDGNVTIKLFPKDALKLLAVVRAAAKMKAETEEALARYSHLGYFVDSKPRGVKLELWNALDALESDNED